MFDLLPQVLVSGITLGMIYGLIAFGYQLTFLTSRTVNFGQGEALAVGALVGLSLLPSLGYWAMLPVAMFSGGLYGLFVERVGVRPPLNAKSEGWVLATIAIGIVIKNVSENVWGKEDLPFPSPLSSSPINFAGAFILPTEILIVFGALLLMGLIELLNRGTLYGRAFAATADDRDAAGLMGINTTRMIALSYALSCGTAAYAGVLVAPVTLAGAGMGIVLALKGFAAAILGGLTSGLGAVAGGLIIGIAEALTAFYISTGYKEVPGLIILLVALALKPAGLFGQPTIRKV
jgi:branched-chain amino acid transport system permease protein